MSTREHAETGLKLDQAWFIRETTTGQIPADPDWLLPSDNVTDVTWSPSPNIEPREGLGTPYTVEHDKGNEEHEITLVYDLQRDTVDSNGDPDDPSGDAWVRDADGQIQNTHALQIRDSRTSSDPDDPTDSAGARTYLVAKGGFPDVEQELDPEGGSPVANTVTWTFEKARSYEIFQPDSQGLTVESTDTGDTSQSVTIEDDAGTSETVALNGTTPVATTKLDWNSIRAIELDAETTGDVIVKSDTNTEELARLRGAQYYHPANEDLEGDLGVSAIGAGSEASAVGTAYVYFIGASVTRGGSALPYDLNRVGLSVDNGYDPTPRHDSTRMRVTEGNADITVEADVVGWGGSNQYIDEALGVAEEDIVITLSNAEFTFSNAACTDPGDRERASDDTAIQYSASFAPRADPAVSVTQVT